MDSVFHRSYSVTRRCELEINRTARVIFRGVLHTLRKAKKPVISNNSTDYWLLTSDYFFSYGTSTVSSLPMKVKFGRLRPFIYFAAVCESAVTSIGSAMVVSQLT